MNQKYLDYEHLQYYHQKLNHKVNNSIISEDDLNDELSLIFSEYRNKTYYVSNNKFLRIKLASIDSSSGYYVRIPIEWELNDLILSRNSEYVYANAFSTCETSSFFYTDEYVGTRAITSDIDGISIELLCTDSQSNLYYFSTIGNDRPNFENSPHKGWGFTSNWTNLGNWDNGDWNFVDFDIPVGSSKTYHLNYYSDSYDYELEGPSNKPEGKFISSDNFNITIMHSVYGKYSVIIK